MTMSELRISRISAIIPLMLSLLLLSLIPFQVERAEAALTEPVIGARVYPLLIVAVMLGLSVFRLWKVFRTTELLEAGAAALASPRWLSGALLLLLYAGLMPLLGFAPASLLAMLAVMRVLGEPIRPVGMAYCALSVGAVWFIFGKFLEIPLPTGAF